MNIIQTICKKAGYTEETISMIANHAEKMEKNELSLPFDKNGRFFVELEQQDTALRNAQVLLQSCSNSNDFAIKKGIELYPYYSENGYLKLSVSVSGTEYSELEKYGLNWSSSFKIYPEDIIKNRISIPELGIDTKAIKFLQKYEIASKDAIDLFNKSNSGSTKRYFCISKNPIDLLMASTGQSFSSCLGFSSVYQRSYYLSLPAMIADKNRYICFFTDKKPVITELCGIEIEHFRYQQRNWIIADRNGNVFVEKSYPSYIYDISPILESLGLSESDFKFSKTVPFDTGFFASKIFLKPLIYLDNLSVELTENEEWRYIGAKGDQGELSPDIRCGVPFEYFSGNIDNYNPEQTQKRKICSKCRRTVNADEENIINDDIYCDDCYNDLIICSQCGDICDPDDYAHSDNHGNICASCHDRHFEFCEFCNDYHRRNTMTDIPDYGMVCDYHLHRLFKFCDVCQKYHKKDETDFIYLDFEQEHVCEYCLDGYAVQCHNCKSWHKKERAFKILAPAEYANDHFCYSCYVFRHESCTLTFEESY